MKKEHTLLLTTIPRLYLLTQKQQLVDITPEIFVNLIKYMK